MFERLGSWTFRFRFLIVIAWVVMGALMGAFAPSLSGAGSTDQTTFLPENSPSRQARDAIERAFPGSTSATSATITLDRPEGLTEADLQWRDEFAAWVVSDDAPEELRAAVSETETADSRPELEELFRAPDGTFELMVINLNVADAGDAAKAVVEDLREHIAESAPEGLEVHVTGAAAISSDYLEAVQVGTDSTTAVTIILVIVVLLAIYRAPLAALIPLITIGAAFVVSTGVLGFLAAAGWQVSSTLATFLVVMVFGVGTDYAIFLISRYREEVSHDGDWHDAARITVRRIGAVITASAGTVIVGMLAMGVGDFKMISTMGPGIAIAVAITLVANLTLSPALLSIFGHYLFWPLHTREKQEGEPRGFFASLANRVSRRPAAWTAGILVLLIIPALYLPQVNSNFDVLADLPAEADSRIGYEQIGTHLGEDKLVQSTALLDGGGDTDMLAPAQLAKLHALMVSLHESGGVATTVSIVTPDGDTVTPDGFRPSKTLEEIADGFEGDDASTVDTDTGTGAEKTGLLDPEVEDGLNQALDYVNGLGVAFPDVNAGSEMRRTKATLEHALEITDRVQANAVLSTQLRTLAASITDPANTASSSGSDDEEGAGDSLMRDYLAELAVAYPEVKGLDAYKDGVRAARSLERDPSIDAALGLSNAFDRLADHFDDRPDATLTADSLAGTAAAKELRKEAEDTFDALPGDFGALAAVFATRRDDFYLPTNLTGEDAEDLQDAIDAFVSDDRTATRFYLTSTSTAYSSDSFEIIRDTRELVGSEAAAFGAAASGHVGGPTAQFADVQDTLAQDFLKVGVITVFGILVVLMLLLRAIVAPLYLVATVLVSYASTIGISGFLFQEVMGHPGISPYLPLMVFVLLVALGSDYNIFLMHRVREEHETRSMRDAVRIASGHTGAVITSAGIILAGTFGSMATAPLMILFQVGIAVAIGVLIDTFLVRSILVPAITTLVDDRAWWPSGSAFMGNLGKGPVPAGAGTGVAAGAGMALAVAGDGAGSGAASPVAAPSEPSPVERVPAPVVAGAAGGTAVAAMPAPGPSRTRLAVAIGLAVLVPVTVAGLLTWSFGSASGNLAAVRAAVVNLDEGGTVPRLDGTPQLLALGSDLAAALTTGGDDGFTWVATNEEEAQRGLDTGSYAAVLTIPAEFSSSVATIRTDTSGTAPKATLRVATDDGSGYTLGTVARAVTAAIGTATAQDITASYVDDVLVQVSTAKDALASAATDAGTLADDGEELADTAAGAGAVAETVSSGLRQLADGADSAAAGTTQLVDGMNQLAGGTVKLADGAADLADGADAAADGAAKLSSGAGDLADGLAQLDAQTSALPGQVEQLADGATGVATGAAGLADGVDQLAGGLDEMATQSDGMGAGAAQLDDGAAALEQGARDLRDGADAAAAGAAQLATGAGDLEAGVAGYTGGVDALAANCVALGGSAAICAQLDALAAESAGLRAGATGVSDGADGTSTGIAGIASGLDGIVSGADGVHDGTAALATSLPLLEAGIADSASGAADLASGAGSLATGAQQLAGGVEQLSDGMPALADGISQLSDGAAALADGMDEYADGMNRLSDGTAALASGARQTASGATRLADGTSEAAGGIGQLTDAMTSAADGAALVEEQVKDLADSGSTLADGAGDLQDDLSGTADGLAAYDEATRSRVGGLAADPVAIEATRVNAVSGAEAGFAPYFMALAAWLGAMGAFLVLPAVGRRDDRKWWLSVARSFLAAGAVAVAGSVLMVIVVDLLLGMAVASPALLILFAVLSALAFTAVIQALVALFGTRGWFAALLLLVLGIAASGLGVDAAAIPGPLAALRPLLPLTYAIDAFRAAIAGAGGSLGIDLVVLTGFLVAGVLVTLATAASADRRAGTGVEATVA